MQNSSSLTDKLFTTAIIGGVAVGGYFFISSKMKQAAKRDTESKLGQSPSGQQALAIRNALNPSGMAWLMSMDTTNTKELMKIARQIKDFKQVAEAYRNLYDSDLSTDLTNEMSAKESQTFFALANATFYKRYLVGEQIPVITPTITFFKASAPLKSNIVFTQKVPFVNMGTRVVTVIMKDGKQVMNEITYKGKNYWVMAKQLKPKK